LQHSRSWLDGVSTYPRHVVDPALLKAVARSRAWFEELASGQVRSLADVARREKVTRRYVERSWKQSARGDSPPN
jgi:hypothetical protein